MPPTPTIAVASTEALPFTVERRSDKRNFALLLLCCAALFIWRLWSPPLLDPGDGYFTEAAREMVESGDYIVPHLNYQIYFSKPILIYWLISSAYHVLGVNEFAGRIWSAIMATALVLCAYWMVRCISNSRAGLIAGTLLASSPLVVTYARMSLVDMTFSSLLGIAWCALVMTVATESRKWWPIMYVALGLSLLTKGPAGGVLFVAACAAYLIAVRPGWAWIGTQLKKVHLLWGLLLFAAITVPWHIAVGLATNWLYLKVFYLYENVGRYAGQTNHNHPEPWFYLVVFGYGFF
jgi:4-amino-4-deoxy-L-arabinose transferase-like glycosyltransferase